MVESRSAQGSRIYRNTGLRIEMPASEHGFIYGSLARVPEAIAVTVALGRRVIATFRLGPLSDEVTASSLVVFTEQIASCFHKVLQGSSGWEPRQLSCAI
jgi:hypothetical protein